MGNLPSNRIQFGLGGMLQFWKTVRSLSVAEIAAESERPVHVACVGSDVDIRIADGSRLAASRASRHQRAGTMARLC